MNKQVPREGFGFTFAVAYVSFLLHVMLCKVIMEILYHKCPTISSAGIQITPPIIKTVASVKQLSLPKVYMIEPKTKTKKKKREYSKLTLMSQTHFALMPSCIIACV
jgi:hypothetical protein